MKTTVIFHSADYDGIFCREIARKFLPDSELIGWDFANRPLMAIHPGFNQKIYVLDLPIDKPFGLSPNNFPSWVFESVIWIDHHKSSIESHPRNIPGYRIDGVAACRLAWQWFELHKAWDPRELYPPIDLPCKRQFIEREVLEPLAVRLAGEYDVWDHRGDGDLEFQFGLDSEPNPNFQFMLGPGGDDETKEWVHDGGAAMRCYAKRDADIIQTRSFIVEFEGLNFLALNTARCNSNTFASRDMPDTGHDALMGFYFNGKKWTVSLYHARHKKHLDLSKIAVKYGGGGHKGACGFVADRLPFLNLGL